MSKPLWSRPGVRRLNLGRGGGDSRKMEYLLVGALGVIILGSIAVTVWSIVGREESRAAQPKERHFECIKCKHQFTLGVDELRERTVAAGMQEDVGMIRLDCPECKVKKSCLLMTACPKCGKYYLTENTKASAWRLDNPTAPQGQKTPAQRDVCPFCGQDLKEWYTEHYSRKKK